jgi:glycerophosphoryl diester phosphodiesterase
MMKKANKHWTFIIIGILAFIFLGIFLRTQGGSEFVVKRIAHAGGGINGMDYTNSIDALDLNKRAGFSYFELDFSFTSDGNMVCMHDWGDTFKKLFGFSIKEAPSLETFKLFIKDKSRFDICTLDSLIVWMQQNPGSYIISDTKGDNAKVLETISEKVPNFGERMIPQIYFPEEFDVAKKMGYRQIIWTLYKYSGPSVDVLDAIKKFSGPFAVTMSGDRARSGLSVELAKLGIPVYVFTINSLSEKNDLLEKYGVSEIYTDFLTPEQ